MMGAEGVGDNVLASIECLNVKRKHWSSLPEMPQAVFESAVLTYTNKIFVFGGRDMPEVCSWQCALCWWQGVGVPSHNHRLLNITIHTQTLC